MERFKAKLEPVPHGGHFVVVPPPFRHCFGHEHGRFARLEARVEEAPGAVDAGEDRAAEGDVNHGFTSD